MYKGVRLEGSNDKRVIDGWVRQRVRRSNWEHWRSFIGLQRAGPVPTDSQREPNHEEGVTGERQDLQGGEGDGAGVRVWVHQLHHRRGLRQVPEGEAQDHQRRRPPLGHDHPRLRGLRRPPQGLPPQVQGDGGREDRLSRQAAGRRGSPRRQWRRR